MGPQTAHPGLFPSLPSTRRIDLPEANQRESVCLLYESGCSTLSRKRGREWHAPSKALLEDFPLQDFLIGTIEEEWCFCA